MVHVPDEIIMGYADGRVSAEEKAWLEGLLAVDPALRNRLQPFLATAPGQLTAFDAVLAAPIPDRLLETIRATTSTAKKPIARQGLMDRLFPGGLSFLPAAGYAATLLIGVGVGSLLLATAPADDTLVRADRDGFVAAGRLQVALDTIPSNSRKLDKEGDIRPLLSVRDRDGRICRQYEIVGRTKGPQGLRVPRERRRLADPRIDGGSRPERHDAQCEPRRKRRARGRCRERGENASRPE